MPELLAVPACVDVPAGKAAIFARAAMGYTLLMASILPGELSDRSSFARPRENR